MLYFCRYIIYIIRFILLLFLELKLNMMNRRFDKKKTNIVIYPKNTRLTCNHDHQIAQFIWISTLICSFVPIFYQNKSMEIVCIVKSPINHRMKYIMSILMRNCTKRILILVTNWWRHWLSLLLFYTVVLFMIYLVF